MDSFKVSVVVPVYNAAQFLERSVRSALNQSEVVEVILVEDKSKDQSYEICLKLSQEDSRVKLFTHPDHQNLGAGASRNLALQKCTSPFISFLDADDQYLPERFSETKILFEDMNVSGVYEPVSCEFVDEKAKSDFCQMVNIPLNEAESFLSYPKRKLVGKEFFESLVLESNGFPMTDGITIRKFLVEKTGLFNESLRLHQDSEYWIRLAYNGNFTTPQKTVPVATRTQHPGNRITSRNNQSKLNYYRSLRDWSEKVNLDHSLKNFIEKRMYYFEACLKFPGSKLLPKILWRLNYSLKRRA